VRTKRERHDLDYKQTVLSLAKQHRSASDLEKVDRYFMPADDKVSLVVVLLLLSLSLIVSYSSSSNISSSSSSRFTTTLMPVCYRAMLRRTRLCHSMSSVRLAVCDVQVP